MTGSVATGIERIIRDKGFVQGVIAARAGFSDQQFCDMLKGRKIIRADYLVPIAKALGVSVQEIYDAGKEYQPQEAV